MKIMRQIFYSIRNKFNENFYFLLFHTINIFKNRFICLLEWKRNGMKKKNELLPLPQLYQYRKGNKSLCVNVYVLLVVWKIYIKIIFIGTIVALRGQRASIINLMRFNFPIHKASAHPNCHNLHTVILLVT